MASTAECKSRTCCEAGTYKSFAKFGGVCDSTENNSDGACYACPIGTYSAAQNAPTDVTVPRCPDTECTSCGAGFVGLASESQVPNTATSFSDHCHACPMGTMQPVQNQFALDTPATCAVCPAGHWSVTEAHIGTENDDGVIVCENQCSTTCPTGAYEHVACTASSDRECTPKPVPTPATCSADAIVEEQGPPTLMMLSAGFESNKNLTRVILNLVDSIDGDALHLADDTNDPIEVKRTSSNIVLKAEGGVDKAFFVSAMRNITFRSSPAVLSIANRSLAIKVTACTTDTAGVEVCGSSCSRTVKITLCLDCLPKILPEHRRSITYHQGSTAAVSTGSAAVTDQDSPYMKSGTASLDGTCMSGDELAYTSTADIDVTYNNNTNGVTNGTCSLTLTAKSTTVSVATFDAMFESITFKSSVVADLSFADRLLDLTVTDHHDHVSPAATRLISIACSPGHYVNNDDQICASCPAGQWTDEIHAVACKNCAKGRFGGEIGNQTSVDYCTQCEAGTYTVDDGQTSCINCAAGSYGSDLDQTAHTYCKDCPEGEYQNEEAKTECKTCLAGRYNDGTDAAMRVNCFQWTCCNASGVYYSDGSAFANAQCLSCAQGTWLQGAPGTDGKICHTTRSCTNCAAGRHGAGDTLQTSVKHCEDCPAGKYSVLKTTDGETIPIPECTACAFGTFQKHTAQTECESCAQGTYEDTGGAKICKSCATGRYGNNALSKESESHCADCAAGQYQSKEAATECIACTCGTFQALVGQDKCEQCAVGKFQGQEGQTTCSNCNNNTAGQFAGEGACACTSCPVGEFCPLNATCGHNATQLINATGFVTHHATANVCKSCAVGQFNDQVKQESCHHCPDGKYQDAESYETCHECAAGQFSGPELQGDPRRHVYCVNCAVGRFTNTVGSTTCTVCPAGKHTETRFGGAITCVTCVAGKYTTLQMNSEGSTTECVSCEAGTYAPAPESSSCIDCPAGKFNSAMGQSSALACQACLWGTYSPDAGKASCDNNWNTCGKGEYLKFEEPADVYTQAGTCTSCPQGKFQDEPEISSPDKKCKDLSEVYCKCDAGKFLAGYTAAFGGECTSCPAGKFKAVEADPKNWADLDCKNCPMGKFGALEQQTGEGSCTNCAAGTYAPADGGASSCTKCATGKFSSVNSETCTDCAKTIGLWSKWDTCTATCGGGTQTRSRTLTDVATNDEEDREAQCPTTQTRSCNNFACPSTDQCHFLKCRYAENPATGKFGIQVYHHGKEPHNVHHCKLFEMGAGKKHCQCSCWNTEVTTGPTDRRLLVK